MFGVSLDGPQPVIVLEYCAGGIKSNQIKSNQIKSQTHDNSSFDCEENLSHSQFFFD
jgi:hypothetical protein